MKKRSLLVLTLAAFLSVGSFAACGKNGDVSSESVGGVSSSDVQGSNRAFVVRFESNGGGAVSEKTLTEGESLDLNGIFSQPANDGLYFYGWCLDKELTQRAPSVFVPAGDVTLYAEWGEEVKHTLSFDTDGGSEIASVLYKPNAYLVKPADPIRENYTFGGWYKDEARTKEFIFSGTTMPDNNMTVYAKWNEVTAICFETNGGTSMPPLTGTAGDPVTEPAAPSKEGYIFDGWYKDSAGTEKYVFSAIPEQTLTVYAKWHEQQKDIRVNLHINVPDGGNGQSVLSVVQDEGEPLDESGVADAVRQFETEMKQFFLDKFISPDVDLDKAPLYVFNGWAYDEAGTRPFEGSILYAENGTVDLYAAWARSSVYCKLTFFPAEETGEETVLYVVKNTLPDLSEIESAYAEYYRLQGQTFSGFLTPDGASLDKSVAVVTDLRLTPCSVPAETDGN